LLDSQKETVLTASGQCPLSWETTKEPEEADIDEVRLQVFHNCHTWTVMVP
jgi:hypothetical protein